MPPKTRRGVKQEQSSIDNQPTHSNKNRNDEANDSGSDQSINEESIIEWEDYAIGVPLVSTIGQRFPCRKCFPVPKDYANHNDLGKHLRLYHKCKIVFECNSCQTIFKDIRSCHAHQKKTKECNSAKAIPEELAQRPANSGFIQVKRSLFHPKPKANAKNEKINERAPLAAIENEPTTSSAPTLAKISSQKPIRNVIIDESELEEPTDHSSSDELSSSDESPSSESSSFQTAAESEEEVEPRKNQKASTNSRPIRRSISNAISPQPIESPIQIIRQSTPQSINSSPSVEIVQPKPAARQNVQKQAPKPTENDQTLWSRKFDEVENPAGLESILDDLIKLVKEKAQIPMRMGPPKRQRPPQQINTHGRRQNPMNADAGPPFDPAAAARIQKLYRQSRPRTYREITEQSSPFCQIDGQILNEHFTRVFGPSPSTNPEMPKEVPAPGPLIEQNPFEEQFTPKEVWERLKRCSNTAPGPDGIRYAVWKKFDPGAKILTSIFNAVQRLHFIPACWTTSTTILLHKKGDKNEISNWRPIALANTMAKLHSSVLANRLGKWALKNGRISTVQKGFMPVDGCSEHNFLLQSIIENARQNKSRCAIAWLDLTNAFGSVPHETIFKSLHWAGLNEAAINTIRLLYASNSTAIRHSTGTTRQIPIRAGVKQGCPLSPIVFNLAIEPIIRATNQLELGYELHGRKTAVLAYADDLVLIGASPEELQRMLDVTSRVANWAILSFNARKCATLDIDGKKKEALPTKFTVQNANPPSLTIAQQYEYLGVPTGYTRAQSAEKVIDRMNEHTEHIDRSLLAPWQKFDAINTFVLPCLSFHLKNGVVMKKPLVELDKKIKRCGKRWINLPQRAGAEILYLSNTMGGLGLTPLNILADVSQMVHAYRLICSNDLAEFSMETLRKTVQKRIRREPRNKELAKYLNGSMDGDFRTAIADLPTAWSRLRMASRQLKSKMNVNWDWSFGRLQLSLNNSILNPKQAEWSLRAAIREWFRLRLLAKPDQGKVYAITSAQTHSNHFMRAGNFTRFADWRFIHRARLDCVPLNGARRFGEGDKRCRRCGFQSETLPHVLNHCRPMFRAITLRHNAIQDRIVKAFKPKATEIIRVNQTVPGFTENLRPDILIQDEQNKTVKIIDVSMPFENRYQGFEAAKIEKRQKYAEIAEHFKEQGFEVFLEAFLVGPLGGWEPGNEIVLNKLRIGLHYRQLMRRLMVSDAIKWSRDIYVEHLTGTRQYDDADFQGGMDELRAMDDQIGPFG